MDVKQLLKSDEGWRLKVYRDSRGILTIGAGRNLEAKGISEAEAELLLFNDIAGAIADLSTNIHTATIYSSLNAVRQAVLVDVAINVGFEGLLEFRQTLLALAHRDWEAAADALLDSDAARELPRRYYRLSEMLRSGNWPND